MYSQYVVNINMKSLSALTMQGKPYVLPYFFTQIFSNSLVNYTLMK